MCAGQGEWNSQRKGTLMPGIHIRRHRHRHTLHPDLTRLVNHLSRGQGNGQTPLSSVRPPSLLLHLSLHLLLYSFIVSLSKGNCPFPPILTLYISPHAFIFFFPVSPSLLLSLSLFSPHCPCLAIPYSLQCYEHRPFPFLLGTKLCLYHSEL